MKSPRKIALITEFTALAVLLLSIGWLGHLKETGTPVTTFLLIIPFAASFLVMGGFISSLFFRWQETQKNQSADALKMQKIVFILLAVGLSAAWLIAILKTLKIF